LKVLSNSAKLLAEIGFEKRDAKNRLHDGDSALDPDKVDD
jgi:hypothetical protein